MSEHITVEQRGGILLMGFNRPDKRNAFTIEMFHALAKAVHRLDQDPELRVGVIHATGDHFTAGLDLAEWAPRFAAGDPPQFADDELDPFGVTPAIPPCRKPMVIAVQGICYTVGFELMLNCDVRVAARDTRLAMLEVKRGFYAVGGATVRLQREIGWANAQKVLLTGNEMHAAEALRLGLVQAVTEPGEQLETALELAAQIASAAPLGVQASLANSRMAMAQGDAAAFDDFMPVMAELSKTEDIQEGFRSFMERRQAEFKGR